MLEHEVQLSPKTVYSDDLDSVFPGENWFFYWKTSASLWAEKLKLFQGNSKVIIPINWAFHSETGDNYDFAKQKPETDLKKLVDVVRSVNLEPVFLLPLPTSVRHLLLLDLLLTHRAPAQSPFYPARPENHQTHLGEYRQIPISRISVGTTV